MSQISFVETVRALREELAEAIAVAADEDILFEPGVINLEFNVGVTRSGGASAKLKFWVVELGGDGKYQLESIQKVSLSLTAFLKDGRPIRIKQSSKEDPRS